jgi:hypothetical protein
MEEVGMRSKTAVAVGVLLAALALGIGACGGDGDDEDECRICSVDENCESDQECVLAVDGNQRCFETDQETCTLDRVEVGRAPAPVP